MIVAGDKETRNRNCWEDVLPIDETDSSPIPHHKIGFHRENGMLLHDLAFKCAVIKTNEEGDENEKLIMKNKDGK